MFHPPLVSDGRLLRVWSRAVTGIGVNKAVLREINDTNMGLRFGRVYATDTSHECGG